MILIQLVNSHWGTDVVEEGIRLNLQDPPSSQVFQVVFGAEVVPKLITDFAQVLNDDQKKQLAPLFTSGIIMPTRDDYTPGPQG